MQRACTWSLQFCINYQTWYNNNNNNNNNNDDDASLPNCPNAIDLSCCYIIYQQSDDEIVGNQSTFKSQSPQNN